MAYIGRGLDKISNIEKLDVITFDGSQSYTLQKNSTNFVPVSSNNLIVSIDGVVQAGNFTVSGSTIDFGVAVASSSTCDFIMHFGTGVVTQPSDGSVTDAKLAASAINSQTAETTTASGDELLIYDTSASALRKVTRDNLNAGAYAKLHSATFSAASDVDIDGTSIFGSYGDYTKHKIIFHNLTLSANAQFRMRQLESGTAETGSIYSYNGIHLNSNNTNFVNWKGDLDTYIQFSNDNFRGNADSTHAFEVELYKVIPEDNADYLSVIGKYSGNNQDADHRHLFYETFGMTEASNTSNSQRTGVTFFPSTGTISGSYTLYGLKA